jgi:nitrile hydratase accessory protein
MKPADAALNAARAGVQVGRDAERPVFREPWEAQAFALVVALETAELFSWREWTAALSHQIANAHGEPDEAYYRCWHAALEDLVVQKGVVSQAALAEPKAAWESAARATPHGRPILLADDPQPPSEAAVKRAQSPS